MFSLCFVVGHLFTPEEEIWYYPSMSKQFTKEDTTTESLSMRVSQEGLDKEFWESMTSGTGPLVAGTLPGLDVQNEQSMAQSLAEGASKVKAKGTSRREAAVPVEPDTAKEILGAWERVRVFTQRTQSRFIQGG